MLSPLVRIFYVSRARHRMSHGELADLLAGARLRNAEHGITGLLVYDGGWFAQVIEGPKDTVDQLLANITADPRHDEYRLISEGEIDARYFGGWAMDWADLTVVKDRDHAALRRHLDERGIADRSRIYRALLAFIEERQGQR